MIFPVPLHMSISDKRYTLISAYKLNDLYEFYMEVKDGTDDIRYVLNDTYESEEYALWVKEDGITVAYLDEASKFRALTSLYQLLCYDSSSVAFCEVKDKPAFKNRGYMLDISRSKIPTLKTILEYVDFLALMKYNHFELYMESLCYKYDRYKKHYDFECLTAEDLEYLDKYCSDRFIELVPNQNSFGHMSAWLAIDEYRHLGIGDGQTPSGALNPLDEETLTFVDGFYESLLPHFKSDYVNIGFDEVMNLGRYQTEEACLKYGKENVFMDYLNKVADLAYNKYGKKVMFWDDMIVNHPSCYKRIPEGAVALEWGYELIQSQIMGERCRDFKENHIPFYVCPSINTHLSFTGRFDVTSFNLRTAGEVGEKHGAEGYLVTDWGNDSNPHFRWVSYLPAALGGQYAWNVGVEQDGETFKTEFIYAAEDFADKFIFKAKIARLMYRLANYYLLEPERIHVGTMCGHTFFQHMKTQPTKFVNLDKSGDPFYFDNVDRYVKEVLDQIQKSDARTEIKEQVILNGEMVILANLLNKVRVTGEISMAEYGEIKKTALRMEKEYARMWDIDNFPVGKENFINTLRIRVEELAEYVK